MFPTATKENDQVKFTRMTEQSKFILGIEWNRTYILKVKLFIC